MLLVIMMFNLKKTSIVALFFISAQVQADDDFNYGCQLAYSSVERAETELFEYFKFNWNDCIGPKPVTKTPLADEVVVYDCPILGNFLSAVNIIKIKNKPCKASGEETFIVTIQQSPFYVNYDLDPNTKAEEKSPSESNEEVPVS